MEWISRFVQTRRELMGIVWRFPEEKAEEAVCGEWDIKGVLAHIAGWDVYFTMILRQLKLGKDVPYWGDNSSWGENMEKRNEALVRERKGRGWNEVREEFVKASGDFLEEYSHLDEKVWSQRFWAQKNPTPIWVVKHNTEHYREHLEEIEGKMREWEG